MTLAARKVVTRSPKRTVGRINCRWFQDEPIEHESRLEKRFLLRAILFPSLAHIQHQPFKLSLGGREHYTPDFLLTFSNGEQCVVEVKRAERIKELISRFDRIAQRLAEDQRRFFVIHNGQIEGQLRAHRAGLLRRYATMLLPSSILQAVQLLVEKHAKGVSIKTLMDQTGASPIQLYALVARRVVTVSPGLLLSEDDLLFPVNKEVQHGADQFGNWFGCAPWRANA